MLLRSLVLRALSRYWKTTLLSSPSWKKALFLSGKVKTQDAFFHIFNHLHQTGKQVILTSDKAPVDLFDIEQRLLSRFKWGLSAELTTPDYNTRYKILQNKFYTDGAEISEDIIAYLAENIRTNIRELEGVSN